MVTLDCPPIRLGSSYAPPPTLDVLRERLRDAVRRVQVTDTAVLVSATVVVSPLDFLDSFARAGALGLDRLYWDRPDAGVALLGIGAAWTVEAGAAESARAWRNLLRDAVTYDGDSARDQLAGPLLMGGFGFDPHCPSTPLWDGFPAGLLTLPRLLLSTTGDVTTLTANLLVGPDRAAEPDLTGALRLADDMLTHRDESSRNYGDVYVSDVRPRGKWEELVAEGATACGDGLFEKVVLARSVRVRADHPFDAAHALRRLRATYPAVYIFAVARGHNRLGRGTDRTGEDACFLGATPERLVRLVDRTVDVACLAGSAARGVTAAEDERSGQALLRSEKNRGEHAVVVRTVRAALDDLCTDLSVPGAPRLLRLPNVQHLYTPVEGHVREGVGVLDLAARLHPTPAVGGYPRAAALRFIREREGLDRGWYAGPVGYVDRHGEGEFAVALRSALLRGNEATLFAGCGIVADSRPADEYAETCLKLRPMLDALAVSRT